MQFIGTGAGEGIPNPFCKCALCEHARRVGGKEIRTRSSFRVSEEILIDPGADFFGQCAFYGIDFSGVKHILYTHTHDDHFNYTVFWERFVRANGDGSPVHVYFVEDAYDVVDNFYMTSPLTVGREYWVKPTETVFHKMNFFTEYEIGGHKITALPGRHATGIESKSANFLIETRTGKRLYYALDSGWFYDETYEALGGKALDIFIGECTDADPAAMPNSKTAGHMNLPLFVENCDKLLELGAITPETAVYATHINSFGLTHEALCAWAKTLDRPYHIEVAFDTLQID